MVIFVFPKEDSMVSNWVEQNRIFWYFIRNLTHFGSKFCVVGDVPTIYIQNRVGNIMEMSSNECKKSYKLFVHLHMKLLRHLSFSRGVL